MIALKIILVIVGMLFLLFGYFIYFRKKYDLINDFEEDYKAGKKDASYAERVGLIEFIIGIVMIASGVVLFIFM